MTDKISPSYYQIKLEDGKAPIEARNLIEAILKRSSFSGVFSRYQDHCRATALYYLLRADQKGGREDVRKAREWLDFLLNSPDESEPF
jgi:hypothetical protein